MNIENYECRKFFKDVKVGEVFSSYNSATGTDNYYIRIKPVYHSQEKYEAVNLTLAALTFIEEEKLVQIHPNAVLMVQGKTT